MPRKEGKHLGLRLEARVAAKLEALVSDEQKKVGQYATVSQVSVIVGLIEAEYSRRNLDAPHLTPKKKPPATAGE